MPADALHMLRRLDFASAHCACQEARGSHLKSIVMDGYVPARDSGFSARLLLATVFIDQSTQSIDELMITALKQMSFHHPIH